MHVVTLDAWVLAFGCVSMYVITGTMRLSEHVDNARLLCADEPWQCRRTLVGACVIETEGPTLHSNKLCILIKLISIRHLISSLILSLLQR